MQYQQAMHSSRNRNVTLSFIMICDFQSSSSSWRSSVGRVL